MKTLLRQQLLISRLSSSRADVNSIIRDIGNLAAQQSEEKTDQEVSSLFDNVIEQVEDLDQIRSNAAKNAAVQKIKKDVVEIKKSLSPPPFLKEPTPPASTKPITDVELFKLAEKSVFYIKDRHGKILRKIVDKPADKFIDKNYVTATDGTNYYVNSILLPKAKTPTPPPKEPTPPPKPPTPLYHPHPDQKLPCGC